jgi:hypothetical protein
VNLATLPDTVGGATDDDLRRAHRWWCAFLARVRAIFGIIPFDPLPAFFGHNAALKTGQLVIPLYLQLRSVGCGAVVDERLQQAIDWIDGALESGAFEQDVATLDRMSADD